MNEISSRPEDARVSRAPAPDAYHSEDIGKLIAALAQASKSLKNPIKNREVSVYMRKTGGTYTFKYATLDQLLEIIRGPLADQGLIFTQIITGRRLTSLLAHESGQWLRSVREIAYDGGAQDYGSALSYERRYAVQSMFSLAAEEDDDGVAASSDREIVTKEEASARREEMEAGKRKQERGDAVMHPIQEMARLVTDAAGAVEIMITWARESEDIEKLRTDPDWRQLLLETSAAIARGLGKIPGAAWKSAILATKKTDMDAVDTTWHGTWKAEIAELEQAQPAAFRHLKEHMVANYQRVTGQAPTPPPPPPMTTTKPPSQEIKAPAEQEEEEYPGSNLFAHHIYDAAGETISDLYTDALSWSRAYFSTLEASETGDLDNLAHYNTDGIIGALDSGQLNPTATAALLASREPQTSTPPPAAEPINTRMQIPVPQTMGGKPDYMTYQREVAVALRRLTEPEALIEWIRANEPIISQLPEKAQGAPRQLILFRRNEFGIPGTLI